MKNLKKDTTEETAENIDLDTEEHIYHLKVKMPFEVSLPISGEIICLD